jgi:hypothetical protein
LTWFFWKLISINSFLLFKSLSLNRFMSSAKLIVNSACNQWNRIFTSNWILSSSFSTYFIQRVILRFPIDWFWPWDTNSKGRAFKTSLCFVSKNKQINIKVAIQRFRFGFLPCVFWHISYYINIGIQLSLRQKSAKIICKWIIQVEDTSQFLYLGLNNYSCFTILNIYRIIEIWIILHQLCWVPPS